MAETCGAAFEEVTIYCFPIKHFLFLFRRPPGNSIWLVYRVGGLSPGSERRGPLLALQDLAGQSEVQGEWAENEWLRLDALVMRRKPLLLFLTACPYNLSSLTETALDFLFTEALAHKT